MEAMPTLAAFAERYDAGAPQVVWTRLVADLETPVSAYLKLAADKPMSFLLESVEGGATRGRYSVIGLEPDLVWRAEGDKAFINRTPVAKPDAFRAEKLPTLASLRGLLAESQIDLPAELPPMAAGIFGYMGYDTVRLMERLPECTARRAGHSRRHPDAPDADGDLRRHQGRDHHRHPGAPRRQAAGREGLQSGVQTPEERRRSARRAAAALAVCDFAQARGAKTDLEHDARRVQVDGAAGEGVHRRRRHLPGRRLAALLGAVYAAVVLALPRPAPHEPFAVPVPPRLRRLRPRRLQPRDPRARARAAR